VNEQQNQIDSALSQQAMILDQKLKYLHTELQRISTLLIEFEKVKLAANNLKEDEVIINVGAGVLVKARIESSNFLYPIGAGYYISLPKDLVSKRIDEQLESAKKNNDMIRVEIKKLENELIELMKKVNYVWIY